MEPYTFFLTSSLEKVFPDQKPDALAEGAVCTAWRGTRAGVQLVFHSQAGAAAWRFKVAVSGRASDAENAAGGVPAFGLPVL